MRVYVKYTGLQRRDCDVVSQKMCLSFETSAISLIGVHGNYLLFQGMLLMSLCILFMSILSINLSHENGFILLLL